MTFQIITRAQKQVDSAAERACVYGLLAAIFRRELDENLLQALREANLRSALADAGVIFEGDFLDGPIDMVLEKHKVAYTALFIGPGKHIPPYASVHMIGSGDLYGPDTIWAKSFIEDTGFDYLSDFRDLPDHVSVELEFIRNLWTRESEALAAGDRQTAARCRARREFFIEGHLGRWIPRFCDQVIADSNVSFYAEIAKLTKAVVDAEHIQPVHTVGADAEPLLSITG